LFQDLLQRKTQSYGALKCPQGLKAKESLASAARLRIRHSPALRDRSGCSSRALIQPGLKPMNLGRFMSGSSIDEMVPILKKQEELPLPT
jgi:hypothetical protein